MKRFIRSPVKETPPVKDTMSTPASTDLGRTNPAVRELLERSNRLGADPRNTNYAGGNTSRQGHRDRPGHRRAATELLWVKGSGGDLGTLTEKGLAVLRLDRLRALTGVYPGVEREDEMVAAFDFCLHGRGGAAPSIDTAMHGLVDAAHVDHLHPDSGIAIATAADGPALTKEIFGDRVLWVPWRRPGFQLGLDIAAVQRANPQAIGVILGGHGITAWGATSAECEANSREIIETAAAYLAAHGRPAPFGPAVHQTLTRRYAGSARPPCSRCCAASPPPTARRSGHYTDADVVLDFVNSERMPELAALGTSCPDHFLRTKVKPLVVDTAPDAPARRGRGPAQGAARGLPGRLPRLLRAARDRRTARRCAAPTRRSCWCPGVGMFSFGANKQTARVAGEFYVNAINVMRGAESVSRYAPIDEAEKFRIEYWALEEAKLQRHAQAEAAGHPDRVRDRRAAPASAGPIALRLAAEGACVSSPTGTPTRRRKVAGEIGGSRRGDRRARPT